MSEKPLALSVKVLIRDPQGKFLLLRRAMSSKGNPGKWDFPGGKVDPGEAFDLATAREVHEEIGLHIRIERPVGAAESESPAKRIVYLVMEAALVSGQPRLSDEHAEFAWVDRAKLAEHDLCPQFADLARQFAKAGAPPAKKPAAGEEPKSTPTPTGVYEPKTLDTSAVVLPEGLGALIERLAENVHDQWAKDRIAAGWTYGKQRDDASLKHPDLLPYGELEEGEKVYDRNTAEQTLKAIFLMGYKIVKA